MSNTTRTRAELEAAHVAAGIARWGEAEREGLERQARAKHIETLRIEAAIRDLENAGASEAEILDYVARHAIENPGPPLDEADWSSLV